MKKLVLLFLIVFLTSCQLKSGEVSLITEDNVKISGDILIGDGYQPLKNEKPDGDKFDVAIILLHNLGSNKEVYDNFAAYLNSKGFTTLAIDFRGHGKSQGSSEEYKSYVKDVSAAKKFLKEKGYDKIYLAGGSIGANVAVRSAVENDVERILLLSPGLDYHGITVLDVINDYRGELYVVTSASNEKDAQFAWNLKEYYLGTKKIRPETLTDKHGSEIIRENNEEIYATMLWFLTNR